MKALHPAVIPPSMHWLSRFAQKHWKMAIRKPCHWGQARVLNRFNKARWRMYSKNSSGSWSGVNRELFKHRGKCISHILLKICYIQGAANGKSDALWLENSLDHWSFDFGHHKHWLETGNRRGYLLYIFFIHFVWGIYLSLISIKRWKIQFNFPLFIGAFLPCLIVSLIIPISSITSGTVPFGPWFVKVHSTGLVEMAAGFTLILSIFHGTKEEKPYWKNEGHNFEG